MIWRCGAILLAKRLAILTVPVSRGRRNVPIKLSPTQFYTTTFGFTFPFNSHVIPILFHHGLASHSQSILMFLSFSGWWFETFLFSYYILGIIIPTDELIFFRGVGIPPTSFGCLKFPIFVSIFQPFPGAATPAATAQRHLRTLGEGWQEGGAPGGPGGRPLRMRMRHIPQPFSWENDGRWWKMMIHPI